MRIYLAGPMRGIPELNFPLFHATTRWLREKGYEVFNPAEHERDGLRANFHIDTTYICLHADGIALLPNWENSKGAIAEKALAEALGLEVIILDESAN